MTARQFTTASRILEIRKWIAKADERGVPRSDMVLHLSNGDMSGLRRSPDVLTAEISFADGVMRFLDIEVVAAPVGAASSLEERTPG